MCTIFFFNAGKIFRVVTLFGTQIMHRYNISHVMYINGCQWSQQCYWCLVCWTLQLATASRQRGAPVHSCCFVLMTLQCFRIKTITCSSLQHQHQTSLHARWAV